MYAAAPMGIEEKLKTAIEQKYAVFEVIHISPIEAGPLSRAWVAEVVFEGERTSWCVKRHRNKDFRRLAFELSFGERLRADGLELIPRVVLARDGAEYFEIDGALFTCSEYVRGDAPLIWTDFEWSLGHCFSAGAALARYHAAASRAVGNDKALQKAAGASVLKQILPALSGSLNMLETLGTNGHTGAALVVKHSKAIALKAKSIVEEVSAIKTEPVAVHGDYHPGNVLFSGSQVIGIVDLDYVHMESPFYDIGYGALLFATNWRAEGGELAPGTAASGGNSSVPLGAAASRRHLRVSVQAIAEFLEGYLQHSDSMQALVLSGQFQRYVDAHFQLARVLVLQWLIDLYCEHPDLRKQIDLPMINCADSIWSDVL